MARKRTSPIPERTVSLNLFLAWQKNKRKKDAEALQAKIIERNMEMANKDANAHQLPRSKPTIEKALLYGHCLDDGLRDFISTYFEERNALEDVQAATM